MKDEKIHYVNNKDFSKAVEAYCAECREARECGDEDPMVPEYIGECFIRIAEGVSRRPNFAYYSFREEMVLGAIENCLKAIKNFDPNAKTRSGKPNAFGYFTQICFFAFLRVIQKEGRQQEIKDNLMLEGGIDAFADFGDGSNGEAIVNRIRERNDNLKERDKKTKAKHKDRLKTVPKKRRGNSGSLDDFI